ncbi:MAG: hypothetical protein V4579_02035 [Pseudomonadota bacterium]
MQPGFDLRIRSMLKALSETVLPAIDPVNKAAVEQLHITLGSLALLGEQVDHAYAFEMADLHEMVGLIAGLPALAGGTAAATRDVAARAQALSAGPPVSLAQVRDINHDLRSAIVDEIEAAYARLDGAAAGELDRWLLQQSASQIGRERAFVAGTGFDVFPDTLRPIGDVLAN